MSTKPPIKKRPPRTIKEKKFAKAYIETGNAAQAVIDAGYDVKDRHSATNIGSENLAKLGFDHYFAAAGLTDQVISQNITRIAITSKKRDQFTGEETSDDAMQLRASELAVKIMGKFAPPRAPVDEKGETVIPILGDLHVYRNDSDLSDSGAEEAD